MLCPGVSDPGTLAAGHRAHGHRSLPSRHGGAGSEFQDWRSCLLKVSGANELGGAKRGATVHRHQATPGHVQPRYELALQARGRTDLRRPCLAENVGSNAPGGGCASARRAWPALVLAHQVGIRSWTVQAAHSVDRAQSRVNGARIFRRRRQSRSSGCLSSAMEASRSVIANSATRSGVIGSISCALMAAVYGRA